jgi:DNA invertase Pin-like site-specific DNA recombinase
LFKIFFQEFVWPIHEFVLTATQIDALKSSGCELIFEEKSLVDSKSDLSREDDYWLRKGDGVIVWKLDRLGRSLYDLINLVLNLKNKRVEFVSIQDSINTATATGRFTFNILHLLLSSNANYQ